MTEPGKRGSGTCFGEGAPDGKGKQFTRRGCKMRLSWVAFRGLAATAPTIAVVVSREVLFNLPGMD
jgi:hypothetical protein